MNIDWGHVIEGRRSAYPISLFFHYSVGVFGLLQTPSSCFVPHCFNWETMFETWPVHLHGKLV